MPARETRMMQGMKTVAGTTAVNQMTVAVEREIMAVAQEMKEEVQEMMATIMGIMERIRINRSLEDRRSL